MAKRFIDTDLVTKVWFRSLSKTERLFFIYLLSKCDICGVWEIDFESAKFYCGDFDEKKIFENLKNQIVLLDCKKRYWIFDFVSFQSGETLNVKSPVHAKIINLLIKHKFKGQALFDTLANRVLNTQIVIEEVKEAVILKEVLKEEGKDKDEKVNWNSFLEDYPRFEDFWRLYDKKVGSEKSKSAWDKIPQIEKLKIMAYIPNYKIAQPDKKFRKNPQTFLGNKSWNDELITDKKHDDTKTTTAPNENDRF